MSIFPVPLLFAASAATPSFEPCLFILSQFFLCDNPGVCTSRGRELDTNSSNRYNCYFCDFDLCSDCVAGILTRGERGGDGGGEGENTTRRKVARTFSDMWFEGRTHGERRPHRRTRTSPQMLPMTSVAKPLGRPALPLPLPLPLGLPTNLHLPRMPPLLRLPRVRLASPPYPVIDDL